MSKREEITEPEISNLPEFITNFRLTPYSIATDYNVEAALLLYQWNIDLCSEFFKIVHFCEIGLRNAIAEAIVNVHGDSWPWEPGFIASLHSPRRGYSQKRELTRCIERFEKDSEKITNSLTFAFWERMLHSRHQQEIWNQQFFHVFPYLPVEPTVNKSRRNLLNQVSYTRVFRNQIAHHKPIINRVDLRADLDQMIEIVASRCPITANWLYRTENVTSLISHCPVPYTKQVEDESVPTFID